MFNMFNGATAFNNGGSNTIINWDTSSLTNMVAMFKNASSFNQNIGSWDVSSVAYTGGSIGLANMFENASSFNNGGSNTINNWNVSNAGRFDSMFQGASSFNQNIGSWNTSNITWMQNMFHGATSFNQNIGTWNTSNVINMQRMFKDASSFNQNIGGWDVSKVKYWGGMFESATAFNNGGSNTINNWNTSSAEQMQTMFSTATSFNQPVGDWNMSNIDASQNNPLQNMFYGASAFNQDLSGWCVSQLSSEPFAFKTNANSTWRNTASKQPEWGVCNSNVSVILSNTDADNQLAASDTVTITASFSEAMNPAPTISITGVVTNVTMTALTGAEKAVQIGETLYGSGVNDQFGSVGGGSGYGDTHLSKNGKVFAFASGYKAKGKDNKQELDKDDKPLVKNVADMLKKASKKHASQS